MIRFNHFLGFKRPPSWNGFSGSVADAHAQSNNVNGPLGSFGSSATHTQNQAFNFGPNGASASAGLAATQHYYFPNGMKIDVNFSGGTAAINGRNSDSSASSVTVTHPKGTKRVYT